MSSKIDKVCAEIEKGKASGQVGPKSGERKEEPTDDEN